MKRLILLGCLVASMACGGILQPPALPSVPIPPRPAGTPWSVGLNFSPFNADEWTHFSWVEVWRVDPNQAADVIAHGLRPHLAIQCEDDAGVQAAIPFLAQALTVEMGNECNFANDPVSVGQWWARTIATLRNNGFAGRIFTGGLGNLDDDTIVWWNTASTAAGLQPDIVAAWHAYGNWPPQLAKWIAALAGRPHAMTESGYETPDASSEAAAVQAVATDSRQIFEAGSLTYLYYQTHSAAPGAPQGAFGVARFVQPPAPQTYRPVEASIRAAMAFARP